jgi:GT2 family glycosyltransferase
MVIHFVLCSYNRKEQTIRAIESIKRQLNISTFQTKILLIDDLSTDGTPDLVRSTFSDVEVYVSCGNLYWSGATRFGISMISNNAQLVDYIVIMNDDLELVDSALLNLFNAINSFPIGKTVFVGDVLCFESRKIIYGAYHLQMKLLKNSFILDRDNRQGLDTFNGNFVAIPYSVINDLGQIDPVFVHGFGDFDLGLRYSKNGINIVRLDEEVGYSTLNPREIRRITGFKEFISPKYFPLRPYFVFTTRHFGLRGLIIFIHTYLKFGSELLKKRIC